MIMTTFVRSLLFVWALVLIPSTQIFGESGRIPVFVSILPQKQFIEKIGGDRIEVHVMVQPGASPHTYEPRPRQMAAIVEAKAYFAIGVEFEKVWLQRLAAANRSMRIVAMDEGVKKIPMAAYRHRPEDDEPQGHATDKAELDKAHAEKTDPHHHQAEAGLDPHIWLSPQLVRQQIAAIRDALQGIDPAGRSFYQDRYRLFADEIQKLDRELKAVLADKPGRRFMVFHPAWGYFADHYGLEQIAIEVEGKDPKPAQLQAIIAHARERGIRVVFVQPQFSATGAEMVAREIGGEVVFADPLAEDWLANLKMVAEKFRRALR
jgi:zinc transport system substrate-binding protein